MSTFYLKRSDTRPVMEVYLLNPDGSAHDLTGATSATLHVLVPGSLPFTRTMVIDGTPTTGIVRYTWLAADWSAAPPAVNLVAGSHRMEYEIIGPALARMTFPNNGYDTLQVSADIGQA